MIVNHPTLCECPRCRPRGTGQPTGVWTIDDRTGLLRIEERVVSTSPPTKVVIWSRREEPAETQLLDLPPPLQPEPRSWPRAAAPRRPRAAPPPRLAWPAQVRAFVSQREPRRGASTAT